MKQLICTAFHLLVTCVIYLTISSNQWQTIQYHRDCMLWLLLELDTCDYYPSPCILNTELKRELIAFIIFWCKQTIPLWCIIAYHKGDWFRLLTLKNDDCTLIVPWMCSQQCHRSCIALFKMLCFSTCILLILNKLLNSPFK